ncbi:hypothetical protein [Rhizobium rhizogenes]|uniref:hypothetical protein n=1 Tax=Rhizobium rhizogenes TaxID=359 RepID=UPI0015734709|nr:hypothetical protein [Rhizobium rhizogenes]NTF64916.1 hypothetical protein [Rhizobium rhizogenes]NTG96264.1 hypothetical protein [Rhizobium rhizogenes]
MNQRQVLRYIIEQEHRIGSYVDDEPTSLERTPGNDNFLPAGRVIAIPYFEEDGVEGVAELWQPPGPSTGTRRPPARTKAHSRGYLVFQRANRSVSFSSTYELTCTLLLMANSAVVDVEDQPPAVTYIGSDGKEHEHTFDYRATLANGKRMAFAVKPSDQVEKTGICDIIQRTKPNLPSFADQAVLLTDRTLTRAVAWNSKSVLKAQKVRNEDECDRMRHSLRNIHGEVSAFGLARKFDRFADGLNAIWCLLYDGVIEMSTPQQKLVDAPWIRVRTDRL